MTAAWMVRTDPQWVLASFQCSFIVHSPTGMSSPQHRTVQLSHDLRIAPLPGFHIVFPSGEQTRRSQWIRGSSSFHLSSMKAKSGCWNFVSHSCCASPNSAAGKEKCFGFHVPPQPSPAVLINPSVSVSLRTTKHHVHEKVLESNRDLEKVTISSHNYCTLLFLGLDTSSCSLFFSLSFNLSLL